MKLNFPKLTAGRRLVRSILAIALLSFSIVQVTNLSLWASLICSFIILIVTHLTLIVYRWQGYYRFLESIGTHLPSEKFHSGERVVSIIPYRRGEMSCSARLDDESLMFGKPGHYREVPFPQIDDLEFAIFYGHKVAKVTLVDSEISFFIPWMESFDEFLEKEND